MKKIRLCSQPECESAEGEQEVIVEVSSDKDELGKKLIFMPEVYNKEAVK